jgi:hypothetical protein
MFGILILDRSPLYKHFEDTTLDVVLLLQAKDPGNPDHHVSKWSNMHWKPRH